MHLVRVRVEPREKEIHSSIDLLGRTIKNLLFTCSYFSQLCASLVKARGAQGEIEQSGGRRIRRVSGKARPYSVEQCGKDRGVGLGRGGGDHIGAVDMR